MLPTRLGILCMFCAVAGGAATWGWLHHAQPTLPPPVTVPHPGPTPTPAQPLLDALAESAAAAHPDQVLRYTAALAALGDEALPAIRQRLRQGELRPQVLAAYATALVEVGREQVLEDAATLWHSDKATPDLKRALVIALSKCRSPEAGKALLAFWTEEADPQVQDLLAQTLKANPKVSGQLVATAWEQSKDEALSKRLQNLTFEIASQASRQEEARGLTALDPATPQGLAKLRGILAGPDAANKSLALMLLEKRGDAEALSAVLAFARGGAVEPGLRVQALSAYCRRADPTQAAALASWYSDVDPKVRSDVLAAIGQSDNGVFLSFVTEQSSRAEDQGLRKQAGRAKDLLDIAENRRKLGLKP